LIRFGLFDSKQLNLEQGIDRCEWHGCRSGEPARESQPALDKALASFDRTAVWRSNGLWKLPFGKGKRVLGNAGGVLNRIVGGWQTGAILTVQDGEPFSLIGTAGTVNLKTGDTAVALADIGSLGGVTYTGSGVSYFNGVRQVPDPSHSNTTAVNNIRNQSTILAVADASGKVLLANPVPGQLGNLAMGVLWGPGLFNIDVNLVKRIPINEKVTLQLQADALSLTNTPQFANPTAANFSINSATFGNITGLNTFGTGGARVVVLKGRINF